MRLGNRYEIHEQIAVGGMGTVYRALDERLHRKVAVKVLKDHLSHDERFVERFRREARAVASLTHPNIASLYDYGEDDGRHFIVMELVDGTDLATVLRDEGALTPDRAKHIIEQICAALSLAHGLGLIHRDVKPANVLLTEDGTAKVTDFGIARATGDSTLTATGSILGTAHYLAPEQAAGEPASPATDVYATGIVLFEMLTGKVPFTADSPVTVAARHMNDTVPVPSSVTPDVPPHLDEVVRKATAKDPQERYPDADAMRAALGGAIVSPTSAATEVLTAPSSQTTPLPVLSRTGFDSRRLAVGALAALVLIALALLAFRLMEDEDKKTRAGDRQKQTDPAGSESNTEPEEELVEIPEVRGLELAEAMLALDDAGLSGIVPGGQTIGTVIGVEPEPGSEIEKGGTVTLTVVEADVDEDEEVDEPKDDEAEDDENGPPEHSNGKGKDKEKKDK